MVSPSHAFLPRLLEPAHQEIYEPI